MKHPIFQHCLGPVFTCQSCYSEYVELLGVRSGWESWHNERHRSWAWSEEKAAMMTLPSLLIDNLAKAHPLTAGVDGRRDP